MKSGNGAVRAAVLVLFAGAVAHAGSEEEIARCANMPSLAERVVCLEEALRRTDPADSGPGRVPGTDSRMPPVPASGTGTAGEREAAEPDAEPNPRDAASFGLDVSRPEPKSPESIRVTVAAVEQSAYGKLRYVTGDGQVWQQIDQRTPRYPDVPFDAEIRTAAAGSFFLKPLSGGIAVRVQRKR